MSMTEISMTAIRPVIGQLVRRAALARERVTITDHGQAAAVLISADELADLEDALALAQLHLARANGTSGDLVPIAEVRRRLGIPQ
jgi:prevent-host-death family protein